MPLYEYYCEKCDNVFESLRSIAESDNPAPCPKCNNQAKRIMPTTFASRSFRDGWARRVPFHHHPVRADQPKKPMAKLKSQKTEKPAKGKKRKKTVGGDRI